MSPFRLLVPVLNTRPTLERTLGNDPVRLARAEAACWRLFRAYAVGGAVAWLVALGTLAGLAWAGLLPPDGGRFAAAVGLSATAAFGTLALAHYPRAFADRGSRRVRWAVLAAGLPSAALLLAGLGLMLAAAAGLVDRPFAG